LRYYGQSYHLTIPVPSGSLPESTVLEAARAFHEAHERAYGYAEPSEPIEIVNVRLTVLGKIAKPSLAAGAPTVGEESGRAEKSRRPVFFKGSGFVETPILDRHRLTAGQSIVGPAIVEQRDSTVVVHPDWGGTVDPGGNLVLSRGAAAPTRPRPR
jgi:N-methylhydantoinase A